MELTKETLQEIKKVALSSITAEHDYEWRRAYVNLMDACEDLIEFLEREEEFEKDNTQKI